MTETTSNFGDIFTFFIPLIPLAIAILAAIDGTRVVFRGTRNYMVENGANTALARLAGFIGALSVFISGAAIIISVCSWFSGMGFIKPTKYGTDTSLPQKSDA